MADDPKKKKKPADDKGGDKAKPKDDAKPKGDKKPPPGGGPPGGPGAPPEDPAADPMAMGGGDPTQGAPLGDPMNALPFPPVGGGDIGPAPPGALGSGPPDLMAMLGLGGGGMDPMGGGMPGMGGPPPPPQMAGPGAAMGGPGGGLPIGGSMPPPGDPGMADSPLLQALGASMSDPMGGDGQPVDLNTGPAINPNLQAMLQMLAMAQAGIGGPGAGMPMGGGMPGM